MADWEGWDEPSQPFVTPIRNTGYETLVPVESRIATTRSLYHGTLRDNLDLIRRLGLQPGVGDFTSDAYGLDEDGDFHQGDDSYTSDEIGIEPAVFMTDKQRLNKALTAIRSNVSKKLGIDFHSVTPQHVQNHGLLVKQPGEMGWSDDPRSDSHLQLPYVPDDEREEPWEGDQKWTEQNRYREHPYQAEPGDFYSDSQVGPSGLQFIHGPAMMRVFRQQGLLDPQSWNPGGIGGQQIPPPYGTPPQVTSATHLSPAHETPSLYYHIAPTSIRDSIQQHGLDYTRGDLVAQQQRRDNAAGNWYDPDDYDEDEELPEYPLGNYVFDDRQRAQDYLEESQRYGAPSQDMWEIQHDSPLEEDPDETLWGSFYTQQPFRPQQVRRVAGTVSKSYSLSPADELREWLADMATQSISPMDQDVVSPHVDDVSQLQYTPPVTYRERVLVPPAEMPKHAKEEEKPEKKNPLEEADSYIQETHSMPGGGEITIFKGLKKGIKEATYWSSAEAPKVSATSGYETFTFPTGKQMHVDWDRGMIRDPEDPEDEQTFDEFMNDMGWRYNPSDFVEPPDEHEEFWRNPYEVFHGTATENVEGIKRNGLEPRNRTRGIQNRGIGGAVFASPDPETPAYHYGPGVFRIDTRAMKDDGYMPRVSTDGFEDANHKESVAAALGHDWYDEGNYGGEDPSTVVFHGPIPPQYLSLLDENEHYGSVKTADAPINSGDATADALGKNPSIEPSPKVDMDYLEAALCPICYQTHRPDEPCPDTHVEQFRQQERHWYDTDSNTVHPPEAHPSTDLITGAVRTTESDWSEDDVRSRVSRLG